MRKGKPGGALGLDSQFQNYPIFLFFNLYLYLKFSVTHILTMMPFVFLDGFADPHATMPNFGLINQESLDKILKAEVFIHSND